MKTIIHVNQHHIKHNAKHPDKRKPVLTVKGKRGNLYADEVTIWGESKVVYRPDNPLSCGAKVWIETFDEVTFPLGCMDYEQAKEKELGS